MLHKMGQVKATMFIFFQVISKQVMNLVGHYIEIDDKLIHAVGTLFRSQTFNGQ